MEEILAIRGHKISRLSKSTKEIKFYTKSFSIIETIKHFSQVLNQALLITDPKGSKCAQALKWNDKSTDLK